MTSAIAAQDRLTCRDRAILRAVAAGTGELSGGMHPDLYLEGRSCCDQIAAHHLATAGLIATSYPVLQPGRRAPARLTAAGRAALDQFTPDQGV